jgi:hypothetical protein
MAVPCENGMGRAGVVVLHENSMIRGPGVEEKEKRAATQARGGLLARRAVRRGSWAKTWRSGCPSRRCRISKKKRAGRAASCSLPIFKAGVAENLYPHPPLPPLY